ncbi:PD40 domain-containing protein [Polyangium aurulentum]|uniref:PD40 domain-containing protein n=1 Tax=Polyangium aurulentum TaxID=2567896 RepID=UPI0010ADD78B|nr:PD40 domain-containing protein [Polyangium aurulentum]UQA63074.1 PD40 domain-containing protein [Polyangium aurulentum]
MLRKTGSPDRVLVAVRDEEWGDALPSQRRFQVSPDARILAYTRPDTEALELVRRDGRATNIGGVREGDVRFSPDGKVLAVVRIGYDTQLVTRVDLSRFEADTWAELRSPTWIEHCADGLVVLHLDDHESDACLTLLPWEGAPQRLVQTEWGLSRFTVAKAGRRIVYFHRKGIYAVEGPGAAPERIGSVPDSYVGLVQNAEMSPDGRSVAFTSGRGLYVIEGSAEPALRGAADEAVHSIWFSRDGRELAWASGARAVWRKDGEERTLEAEGAPIAAMRFLQASPGLIVSRGREVLRWSPARGEVEGITTLDDAGKGLLGADVFDGGIVLWTGTPWEQARPKPRL